MLMVKSGLCSKCILCGEKIQFNVFLASFLQQKMSFILKKQPQSPNKTIH